jgi:hypothetical protein
VQKKHLNYLRESRFRLLKIPFSGKLKKIGIIFNFIRHLLQNFGLFLPPPQWQFGLINFRPQLNGQSLNFLFVAKKSEKVS